MTLRTDYDHTEPAGGRKTVKFHGADAYDHAVAINGLVAAGGITPASVHALSGKTPVGADEILILDSAASWVAKKATLTQIVTMVTAAMAVGAPATLDTIDELAAAINDDASYAATIVTALALKAPLASPTFTGTVSGITKAMVGLGNVDNTSNATERAAAVALTNKDLTAKSNVLSPANVGANFTNNVYVSGKYYFCNGSTFAVTYGGTTAYNNLPAATPFVVCDTITLTRLFCEFTVAGEANSKFRMVIWNHDAATQTPGTVALDGGTISTGSGNAGDLATGGTPGVYERTVSQVLTPGIYWSGGIIQGSSTTAPTLRSSQISMPHMLIPMGTLPPAAGLTGALLSSPTQSGAAATWGTSSIFNQAPRLGFKVA